MMARKDTKLNTTQKAESTQLAGTVSCKAMSEAKLYISIFMQADN